MTNGQRAGLTFISGSSFGWVSVRMLGGTRYVRWEDGEGPALTGDQAFLRGRYRGDTARLEYSLDGVAYTDTGVAFPLRFGHWKARASGSSRTAAAATSTWTTCATATATGP
jgi:hypothetical protein